MKLYRSLALLFALVAALVGLSLVLPKNPDRVFAQAGPFGAAAYAVPCTVNGNSCVYGAAALGVNAITEPSSGTTALSAIVDTRGAREATINAVCTTGPWTINVQTYAADGVTAFALAVPVTAIAANTNTAMSIGSEANPATSGGTLSATALVRFPQRAIAFSFTNSGAAGTCTAVLFLSY